MAPWRNALLVPVLPDEKDFPYTMRLVSEVMSSNGSTSMASVCGSTLALMDTGVPIKAPVAGIAMGLIKEGEDYTVLTDIQGLEDHLGDMDFKVAGTETGITALQMDIKIKGITPKIMEESLAQAKEARFAILAKIKAVIAAPRAELKEFVPRIVTMHIPVDKIGAVIGPGGKMIRALQEETGTQIDIAEDGTVYIAAVEKVNEDKARERIEQLTESPVIGRIYTGKVVRTTDFGAFVEIMPGTDGMVHISQLDSERVNKVEDIAQVGEELTVMITAIDPAGKIRLSRQAVLEGWTAEEAREHDSANRKAPAAVTAVQEIGVADKATTARDQIVRINTKPVNISSPVFSFPGLEARAFADPGYLIFQPKKLAWQCGHPRDIPFPQNTWTVHDLFRKP